MEITSLNHVVWMQGSQQQSLGNTIPTFFCQVAFYCRNSLVELDKEFCPFVALVRVYYEQGLRFSSVFNQFLLVEGLLQLHF